MKRTVNTLRSAIGILLALIVLIPAAACKDKTSAESRPKMSAPVTELKCTAPASLSAIYPTVNNNVIVCWTDIFGISSTNKPHPSNRIVIPAFKYCRCQIPIRLKIIS